MTVTSRHSAVIGGTAYDDQNLASQAITFFCRQAVNFVANDSDSFSMLVNFDAPAGLGGTIRIRAGEVLNDLPISCSSLYVRGEGGSVPFRALGA